MNKELDNMKLDSMKKAKELAAQGRHKEAVKELEDWLKDHGPDQEAHKLLLKEKHREAAFEKPAGPFAYRPVPSKDPRAVLYERWLNGEDVLDALIQAHLMVPRDKTVVPEVIRLISRQPKSVRNLYLLAVTLGDRADDYPAGLKFSEVFLKHWKTEDEVRQRMERMQAYWKDRPADTETLLYRLGHGDVKAMEAQITAGDDPWLQDLWAMHAAANGSEKAFRHLARRAREQGQTELEIRLSRNLTDRKEFIADELDWLVFTLHDLEKAEALAWSFDDETQSDWLRLIHYEQGKTHDREGIEALDERYTASLN